jgi:hypothetical protein
MTTSISRAHSRSKHLRTHIMEGNRPLCGGGFQARLENAWQADLGEPTCQRCLAIQAKRRLNLSQQMLDKPNREDDGQRD